MEIQQSEDAISFGVGRSKLTVYPDDTFKANDRHIVQYAFGERIVGDKIPGAWAEANDDPGAFGREYAKGAIKFAAYVWKAWRPYREGLDFRKTICKHVAIGITWRSYLRSEWARVINVHGPKFVALVCAMFRHQKDETGEVWKSAVVDYLVLVEDFGKDEILELTE
jgi:hypothetical protein